MLTGLEDSDSVEEAFHVGATDFISKPINWTLLRFRIRYVLRSAQVMKELVRSKDSLSSAQRIARLGSWEWFVPADDAQRSSQYYRLFGQHADTFGEGMEALVAHVYEPDRAMVQAALEGARQGIGYQLTYRVVWPDGSVRTLLETAERAGDLAAESLGGLVMEGSAQDITEQVEAQRRIRQLAYFDPLTGLPNREFFREGLLAATARCLRNDSRCAVMVVDIDRFARINDSLGPERGDQVLQVIGHRLRDCMGDRTPAEPAGGGGLPRLKVARMAADEFGILVTDAGPVEEVLAIAHKLVQVVCAPIRVPGQEITLSARVGRGADARSRNRRGCAAEGRRNRPQPGQADYPRPGGAVFRRDEGGRLSALYAGGRSAPGHRRGRAEGALPAHRRREPPRDRQGGGAGALAAHVARAGAAAGVHFAGRGNRHDRAAHAGRDGARVQRHRRAGALRCRRISASASTCRA
jgi:diguanylate cyclase (GGDEF)-like protein